MTLCKKRLLTLGVTVLTLCLLFTTAVSATGSTGGAGNVASAVESTWSAASGQIKEVVNNVIFPAIDMILAIFFFVKMGTAYFDCAPVTALQ